MRHKSNTELKPCPFCGMSESLEKTQDESGCFDRIICNSLKGGCGMSSGGYENYEELIAHWNTRQNQDAAMREALGKLKNIGSELVLCLEEYDWDKLNVPMTPIAEMQIWHEAILQIETQDRTGIMNKELKQYSDIELLKELIERNGHADAPVAARWHGVWNETLIEIGSDETAKVLFTEDALEFLDAYRRD